MSLSCRYAAQCCARQLRTSAAPSVRASASFLQQQQQQQQQRVTRRYNSTEASTPTNPKIAAIVDQISQLTLLETADLVASLKVRNHHHPPHTHTHTHTQPAPRAVSTGCLDGWMQSGVASAAELVVQCMLLT